MPWWAYAWRYREEFDDSPNPGRWWHHCLGSAAWWVDKLLERLPGAALFNSFEEWYAATTTKAGDE